MDARHDMVVSLRPALEDEDLTGRWTQDRWGLDSVAVPVADDDTIIGPSDDVVAIADSDRVALDDDRLGATIANGVGVRACRPSTRGAPTLKGRGRERGGRRVRRLGAVDPRGGTGGIEQDRHASRAGGERDRGSQRSGTSARRRFVGRQRDCHLDGASRARAGGRRAGSS